MPGRSSLSTVRAVTAPTAAASTPAEPWWRTAAPAVWLRRHPRIADALLLLPIVVMVAVGTFLDGPHNSRGVERDVDALGAVLIVGTILPVVWRRRAPRLVLAISVACQVPFLALGYVEHGSGYANLLALYTVAAHCERRQAFVALGWTAAVMFPLLVAGVFYEGEQLPVSVVIANVIIFATAWLAGDAMRNRRRLVAELRFRAETAERQRDEEARQAVLAERARIAREMHDIVAHSMSVMIVQAGGARRILEKRPDQAAQALASIERTGREAMAEMRRLLGVLREDETTATTDGTGSGAADEGANGSGPAPLAPQPGLATVPALVAQWNDAGLPVTLHADALPDEVPASVDVSAYRLVQEALTNVSKHAGPATATVTITADDDRLDIRVEDDGRGAGAAPTAGTGHGIIGMHERVAVFGGTVTAGPRAGGGWAVHASLPLSGGSSEPTLLTATAPARGANRARSSAPTDTETATDGSTPAPEAAPAAGGRTRA